MALLSSGSLHLVIIIFIQFPNYVDNLFCSCFPKSLIILRILKLNVKVIINKALLIKGATEKAVWQFTIIA